MKNLAFMIKLEYLKLSPEQIDFCLNHAEQINMVYERVNGSKKAFILMPEQLYAIMEKI